jgi:hypothetical protein
MQNRHFPVFKNQEREEKKGFNQWHELTPYFFGKISRKIRIADCLAQLVPWTNYSAHFNPERKKSAHILN